MARRFLALMMAVMLAWRVAAHAVQPDEVMPDPALEARARALSREIRCMVCQNQSIDDSDAPLARDLRLLVRERVAGGDSDAEVRDFLVARYGEFVLLKPPFELHTLLLWLLPPLVLIGGALALWRRRRSSLAEGADGQPLPLTADEEARLKALLAETPPPGPGSSKITKD
jgi:cytochrome c-type biogenesis protein CcmH